MVSLVSLPEQTSSECLQNPTSDSLVRGTETTQYNTRKKGGKRKGKGNGGGKKERKAKEKGKAKAKTKAKRTKEWEEEETEDWGMGEEDEEGDWGSGSEAECNNDLLANEEDEVDKLESSTTATPPPHNSSELEPKDNKPKPKRSELPFSTKPSKKYQQIMALVQGRRAGPQGCFAH
jgi:hypothetical protein